MVAIGTAQDVWSLQAYEIKPIIGRALPVGITARESSDGARTVTLHLPIGEDGRPAGEPSQRERLTGLFQEFTDEQAQSVERNPDMYHVTDASGTDIPLNWPSFQLGFVDADTPEAIEARLRAEASQQGDEEFLGVFEYDLGADLKLLHGRSLEEFETWMDTPNPLNQDRSPREIIGSEDDWIFRDEIIDRKYSSFS
jgi:hypothetical protein